MGDFATAEAMHHLKFGCMQILTEPLNDSIDLEGGIP